MEQTIYLYGDSIGQGVIWDTARQRYRLAPARCVRILAEAGLRIESRARMGMTARDGLAALRADPPEGEGFLAIEFGGNDCDLDWDALQAAPEEGPRARTPLGEFGGLLDQLIREGRLLGLTPVLVTPPPILARRYFDWVSRGRDANALLRGIGDVERISRWQERYAREVCSAAWRNVCGCVDLREAFLGAADFPSLICQDGIHPTAEGQELMARCVLDALDGLRAAGRRAAWAGTRFAG